MPKDAFYGPLERVNDFCWRIPKSYKAGMRVDGLIYADDQMIELIRKDQAPEQVANVAFLPGIQHASLAMPDIHWGYGFCIGGVAATDPDEGGIISPGGVGYDINCLSGKSLIRHEHGYTRRIDEMADVGPQDRLTCFSLQRGAQERTGVQLWFSQVPKAPVLRLRTTGGDEVDATADHPFYTPAEWCPWVNCDPATGLPSLPSPAFPTRPPPTRSSFPIRTSAPSSSREERRTPLSRR